MAKETFTHPEPHAAKHTLWPVFLPFAGCPNKCIYCAQDLLTGQHAFSLQKAYDALEADLRRALDTAGHRPVDLGFFGGTFTLLSEKWQRAFLELAGRYADVGLVRTVRCSTRPDAVSEERLQLLRECGLTLVELGVQSFDDGVLQRSGRGYTAEVVRGAVERIKAQGLQAGIQLLPGLPGHTPSIWKQDLEEACLLRPVAVRIYPCVVLDGTKLADLWRAGTYRPWEMNVTIAALAPAILRFWRESIRVLRIGLAPEDSFRRHLLDGPWHPSLGMRVRSLALYLFLKARLRGVETEPKRLVLPKRLQGEFWGWRGEMRDAYGRLGVGKKAVVFADVAGCTLLTGADCPAS